MAQITGQTFNMAVSWVFGFGIVYSDTHVADSHGPPARSLGLTDGVFGVDSLPSLLLDALLVFPYDMFVQGAQNVYGGLYVWAHFSRLIGYGVDRLRTAAQRPKRDIGLGTLDPLR